ncbi:hypothetical protein [Kamptonema sp. UHCC 0994]|uniref:hypothetical protein n=1 Tax=Kamptonema sp. UHCC 0994 TaxID=3031329 RepID=UPI0023BA818D|nr:hypothetical protein [Kamptonema sp. UHCC 0994]MDF0556397.1 hypothetical protein [Kamptonema sp. UHCC 0994]
MEIGWKGKDGRVINITKKCFYVQLSPSYLKKMDVSVFNGNMSINDEGWVLRLSLSDTREIKKYQP